MERDDLVFAYQRRLNDPDPRVSLAAAENWNDWEGSLLSLLPGTPEAMSDENSLAMARIENYYMTRHLFFEEDDYLLHEAHRLRGIPCHIVQGRYDMICPAETALALAHELPQAKLHIVPDAGHSGGEPGNTSELIAAVLDLHQQLSA
jgi:proline iminopeptidase